VLGFLSIFVNNPGAIEDVSGNFDETLPDLETKRALDHVSIRFKNVCRERTKSRLEF
jgi:hypothetical protein